MKITDLIIFENDDFVALNKPSGLLSIPDREGKEVSLKSLLIAHFGSIFTVHRLDRETSGLIVFAKNDIAHRHLSMQFENRETEKIYTGLVHGSLSNKTGTIEAPIAEHSYKASTMIIHTRGKMSITDYEVVEEFKKFSLLKFQIHTGRTHQIRIHMNHIGHPLSCDNIYGDGKPILLSSLKKKFNLSKKDEEERPLMNRLALHASNLKFNMVNGESVSLEAALQKDFRALLQQLRKAGN
jgi:23S rRNA pseudouridine1911/1915/1917 synthase